MQLSAREHRMTSTISIICLCYFFCNVSTIVCITLGINVGWLYNFLHSFYWMQYSFNVFVYAARNKQYREAYILFLREVVLCQDRDATVPNVVFISRAQKQDHNQEADPEEIIELHPIRKNSLVNRNRPKKSKLHIPGSPILSAKPESAKDKSDKFRSTKEF
jgi:hypothetical protein